MTIKLGNNSTSKVYLGDTEVEKLYLGDTLVFGVEAETLYAATYDPVTYLLEVQQTGQGTPSIVHTGMIAPDKDDVIVNYPANVPAWAGGRVVSPTEVYADDGTGILLDPQPYLIADDSDFVVPITDFLLTMRTTTANETITLPLNGTNNFDIDWGDGTVEHNVVSHEYVSAGDNDIAISGTCPSIYFNSGGDATKLIKVENLGKTDWTALAKGFYGCSNIELFVAGGTDTSLVTNMIFMMNGWSSMTTPPDLSGFNTANATNMYGMMDGWSSMTTPPDLSGFNTANATNMYGMMYGWSSMTTPPDLSGFNTANVTSMSAMMVGWSAMGSIDISIDLWDIGLVTAMSGMLQSTTLSTACYDRVLIAWAGKTHQPNVTAHFGNSKYTPSGAAETARDALVTDGWIISDAGPA